MPVIIFHGILVSIVAGLVSAFCTAVAVESSSPLFAALAVICGLVCFGAIGFLVVKAVALELKGVTAQIDPPDGD